jgi:hypothetical protein
MGEIGDILDCFEELKGDRDSKNKVYFNLPIIHEFILIIHESSCSEFTEIKLVGVKSVARAADADRQLQRRSCLHYAVYDPFFDFTYFFQFAGTLGRKNRKLRVVQTFHNYC